MGVAELEQGRADFGRGDWIGAYDAWSAAGLEALAPADLDDLAVSAELVGHHDDAVAALQRAFAAYQAAGDLTGSVRSAFRLAMITATHGEHALSDRKSVV